jgi:DNA-binding transcriptional MerR regulator/methylmalonyl-CoA mutase cobalamin-binding subunit
LDEAPRYPIRAVSKLTGIPIDTLRAWERRYGLVEPQRDARGRLYSEPDVRKLRLLRTLVERGHAIGRLAGLTERQLAALQVDGAAPLPGPPSAAGAVDLAPVIAAIAAFDGRAAERELRRLAALLPPRRLVHEVALPLLRHIGEAWCNGQLAVAQEHLASSALRDLLGTLVRLHAPEEPRVTVLFASPPGERHELGLLAGAMLAAAGGLGVVFLGIDLPVAEVAAAARRSAVRAVVLGIVGAGGVDGIGAAVGELAAALPEPVELWVGGPPLPEVEAAAAAAGARHVADFGAFEEQLAGLGARF